MKKRLICGMLFILVAIMCVPVYVNAYSKTINLEVGRSKTITANSVSPSRPNAYIRERTYSWWCSDPMGLEIDAESYSSACMLTAHEPGTYSVECMIDLYYVVPSGIYNYYGNERQLGGLWTVVVTESSSSSSGGGNAASGAYEIDVSYTDGVEVELPSIPYYRYCSATGSVGIERYSNNYFLISAKSFGNGSTRIYAYNSNGYLYEDTKWNFYVTCSHAFRTAYIIENPTTTSTGELLHCCNWCTYTETKTLQKLSKEVTVTLDKKTVKKKKGDTFSLTATVSPNNKEIEHIFWNSDNPDVATVDDDGNVTVNGYGVCTIYAEDALSGVRATCSIDSHSTGPEYPDANKSGNVDVYDIYEIASHILGESTVQNSSAADFNGDKKITMYDLNKLMAYIKENNASAEMSEEEDKHNINSRGVPMYDEAEVKERTTVVIDASKIIVE